MAARGFYLRTYDMDDGRRRLKLAKIMESVGHLLQYSVFEAYLSAPELQ